MRILVIGGTQFVGRHIVEMALATGDDLTLFHRGQTNPGLFAEAEHRLGDRNSDLSALADGDWDATIDCTAYVPRQVRSLARALDGRGGRYVHISSVHAYAPATSCPGMTEDAPLAVLENPATEEVNNVTYGGLKAMCELTAWAAFGATTAEGGLSGASGVPVSIIRPTYVVGRSTTLDVSPGGSSGSQKAVGTIAEVYEHEMAHPTPQVRKVGLDPARERELLGAN